MLITFISCRFWILRKVDSDGGYAVADFRKVQENLGTMDDLEELTGACHEKGISVCMDFVMNHTSEDHEWAKKARQGDGEYMSRYFFYDTLGHSVRCLRKPCPRYSRPRRPEISPGGLRSAGHYVMTSILSVSVGLKLLQSTVVFNEMVYNLLYPGESGN